MTTADGASQKYLLKFVPTHSPQTVVAPQNQLGISFYQMSERHVISAWALNRTFTAIHTKHLLTILFTITTFSTMSTGSMPRRRSKFESAGLTEK